jgi:anti-sigma factor RsiW
LGGRLVPSPEGAAALFIYENAREERLTLYVRPVSMKRTTRIQTTDIGDVDGCAWVERGVGYSLIASENYARLVELSQYRVADPNARGATEMRTVCRGWV